ncbi:MAG: dephospho-CoA kinase [Leptolyngbya sp. SIO4C1]|nr:dephospho-CoA kinase [Leptolyngbya sp. SIO4C1]
MVQRRILGLTGGIASGKSTVANYLAATYQLPILDADLYARQAVEPGSPILALLVRRYGETLQLTDGSLNRARLGEIIFHKAAEKRWVEQQIHPFVRQQFAAVTATYPLEQTLVYAIPLLFEAGLTSLVTEIWVVTCTPAQQLARLMARSQLSLAQAQVRIASQLPLAEKAAQASVVLDNSGTRAALFEQIDRQLRHPA